MKIFFSLMLVYSGIACAAELTTRNPDGPALMFDFSVKEQMPSATVLSKIVEQNLNNKGRIFLSTILAIADKKLTYLEVEQIFFGARNPHSDDSAARTNLVEEIMYTAQDKPWTRKYQVSDNVTQNA